MKKLFYILALSALTGSALADNLQTLVLQPTPKMTCQNCEKKIKSSLRFVKGTKSIQTSLKDQTITITYDADKAKASDYQAELKKIGRESVVVPAKENTQKKK